MRSFNIQDNPKQILKYQKNFFKEPMLLNINTNRLFGMQELEKIDEFLIDI